MEIMNPQICLICMTSSFAETGMWIHSYSDMGNFEESGAFLQDSRGKERSEENPHSACDKGGK